MFFNNFAFDLFAAFNIQKYNIFVAIIIVIINVTLLLYFVHDYSYNAAAGAKILANLGGSILVFLILAKNNLYKFRFRIQEFIWCTIVLLASYFLFSLPTIVFIILSVVIIAIAAYSLSFFTKDEYAFIKNLLGK
jgi:O-antigen/teichoic acid export membrane protein